jgi:ribosomal RNA assembly protein
MVMKAREVVTAIGRGFPPETAFRLIDEDAELHVISLEGESLKKRKRLFGRVIGRDGGCRKRIENDTGASLAIYGKTLSIIGEQDQVGPAQDAVEELLSGKTHAHAYKKMHIKRAKMI